MGLEKIVEIRQYTAYNKAKKIERRYMITFTTTKTEGEFTFSMLREDYNPADALAEAGQRADAIDAAIK